MVPPITDGHGRIMIWDAITIPTTCIEAPILPMFFYPCFSVTRATNAEFSPVSASVGRECTYPAEKLIKGEKIRRVTVADGDETALKPSVFAAVANDAAIRRVINDDDDRIVSTSCKTNGRHCGQNEQYRNYESKFSSFRSCV